MATAERSEGLQHAVSLGNIDASTKTTSIQVERCYDSEDENMGRRRLRTSSPTELHPRTSVYSKGDIREQYCLTDRQLNTIERPKRERFFGCLSRRGTPHSFLGVCVGRRAPSDENLAAYAPFYKYPRYHHHFNQGIQLPESDLESSYFRRQPASILSTAKCADNFGSNQYSWIEPISASVGFNEDESLTRASDRRANCEMASMDEFHEDAFIVKTFEPQAFTSQSSEQITCIYRCPAHVGLPPPPPAPVPSTPRTKHVSFARSHTLTSFDDISLGLRLSGRMEGTRSQERLLGGKKPIITSGSIYETTISQQAPQQQKQQSLQQADFGTVNASQQRNTLIHQHTHGHPHAHQHIHGQPHQHHALVQQPPPYHIHQSVLVPIYRHEIPLQHSSVDADKPISIITARNLVDDLPSVGVGVGIGAGIGQPANVPTTSPAALTEIVVVEKIKRNAVKTQATQTENRKDNFIHILALSPRTTQKVKVVSQGAQTNGVLNGRKLTKSLLEMTNGERTPAGDEDACQSQEKHQILLEHEYLHRTQSEELSRSPMQTLLKSTTIENEKPNIKPYYPPDQIGISNHQLSQLGISSNICSWKNSSKTSEDSNHSYCSSIQSFAMISSVSQHNNNGSSSITTTCPEGYQTLLSNPESSLNEESGIFPLEYERNSLPRRACGTRCFNNELYSHSLPRREPMHSNEICRHITEFTELMEKNPITVESPREAIPPQQYHILPISEASRRLSMISMQNNNEVQFKPETMRRPSMPNPLTAKKENDPASMQREFSQQNLPAVITLEALVAQKGTAPRMGEAVDYCKEEREIFIDFKPHVSPKPSPTKQYRRKKLQKTYSDGVILGDIFQKQDSLQAPFNHPASQDSLLQNSLERESKQIKNDQKKNNLYENVPIRDETIVKSTNIHNIIISTSNETTASELKKRDRFRMRSISLDDRDVNGEERMHKSGPPSPCQDNLLANTSTYPSSDSLANDLTRDHSDGNWNESQVTVLTAEPRDTIETTDLSLLLTPSSKRKTLILQHQQRSSIDTEVWDLEEQFSDQSPSIVPSLVKSTVTQTVTANSLQKPRDYVSTLKVPDIMSTLMAYSTSASSVSELNSKSPRKSPVAHRKLSETLIPVQDVKKLTTSHTWTIAQKCLELPNTQRVDQAAEDSFSIYGRADSIGRININNTDISECSTNTDEYVTCTETSKHTPGIKTPHTTTSSSSTTQVPVSAQSSQTEKTHDGSSFESASSLYSVRGDGLNDDDPHHNATLATRLENSLALAPQKVARNVTKISPAHSVSSTSSGSYKKAALAQTSSVRKSEDATVQMTNTTSSPRQISPVKMDTSEVETPVTKKKTESMSDDERSEMRYSSSGYYESPNDDDGQATKFRRHKLEDDRRRRKTTMKLDIESENLRALTSPIKKSTPSPTTITANRKDLHLENQAATIVLDASSPNKIKKIRPKMRRQFKRTSRDESNLRKQKNGLTPLRHPTRSAEKLLDYSQPEDRPNNETTSIYPQKPASTSNMACSIETHSHQLKAKSVESLRSISPGSDSVFYSETDALVPDHHAQCSHCGKEVGSVNDAAKGSGCGSQESITCVDKAAGQAPHDIVKPPADFADSPVTTKLSHRLYKKMDKRFRSEERHHGDRNRHYKSRQENIRAKSEERGKENILNSPSALRAAGSSPCVLPEHKNTFEQKNQIIYRGNYDHSRYNRLTDADVWIQLDHQSFDRHRDRRSSTESEKNFHSKYQVILHRLVQRRCTLEMYHRQKNNIFKIDKTVVVKSNSGEFGFRIHGSKPVVVAAIEPDTPAESSGLEVGDIIISVNGVPVLDKHHTEVVKIAHAGCDTLELEVARTISVLLNEQQELPSSALLSGYLWRQSGQAKGSPSSRKWARRWFCLRPDHSLYYYKTEEDTQPVGAIILAKHTVEQCPADIGKSFAFKIDSSEGLPMCLAADTEEISIRWITMLRRSATQADSWLDKSSQKLRLPANGINRPDCFGYLMKLGSRWCGWSKRYCVLKDACLYFYQDATSKSAFGMACLQGYKVSSMSTNASGRKNSFEIIPPESKLRYFYFSTESEMDKKRWISALEYSIDRWIKSG